MRADFAGIRAVDSHPIAHLFEARAYPEAELQRYGVGFGIVDIGEVGREHGYPPLAVAVVHHQSERFFNPRRLLLGADVVEDEQIRLEHRPEDIQFRRFNLAVVSVAYQFEEVARLEKHRASSLSTDRFLHQRDRKVRLAHAVVAVKQQSAIDDGKLIDQAGRATQRVALAVGVRVEVRQLAVPVAARDTRLLQQRLETVLMPAVAACDPRDTLDLNRLPSSVVADRAGHERW